MKKGIILGAWCLILSLSLLGCGAKQTTLIRQGSESATILALVTTEAEITDAQNLRTIAIDVRTIMQGGEVDVTLLKALILEKIADEFDGATEIALVTLANTIVALVMDQIDAATIPPDVVAFATAATEGVESGCTIFILASDGTIVDAVDSGATNP